jgi:hypothetical protein
MDSEPDDQARSAGGSPHGGGSPEDEGLSDHRWSPEDEGRFDHRGSLGGEGRSDGAGQADGPRPGLVGVLWCVVVIVAVLVIGVAMGMLDGR